MRGWGDWRGRGGAIWLGSRSGMACPPPGSAGRVAVALANLLLTLAANLVDILVALDLITGLHQLLNDAIVGERVDGIALPTLVPRRAVQNLDLVNAHQVSHRFIALP